MKEVLAIIRQNKMNETKAALAASGVLAVSSAVSNTLGKWRVGMA